MSKTFQIIDSRLKALPGQSYKYAEGQYALDVPFDDCPITINPQEMSVEFPFADGNRIDGVGDLIEISGINTERHRKNPITLFDHAKAVALPIGVTEDPKTKQYTVIVNTVANRATAKTYFYQGKGLVGVDNKKDYDHALFCEQLFDLIDKKLIRAGSIGYQVLQGRELPGDRLRGVPGGVHLIKTLMLEASIVVMPCNMDTVGKALSMPKICGKKPSPYLIKSLAPYAPEKKVSLLISPKEIEVNTKELDRSKYRKEAKPYIRKVRKSKNGVSIIHIRDSDFPLFEEACIAKGVKSKKSGHSDCGKLKIKLEGADEVMDTLAKKWGRPIKKKEIKLKQGTKSMPMDKEKPEPFGAEVLRKLHGDMGYVMEAYDEQRNVVDNPQVEDLLQAILEALEANMALIEETFELIYSKKGVSPLEGSLGTKEMDEDGSDDVEVTEEVDVEDEPLDTEDVADSQDVADSGRDDDEEVTPKDSVAGMKTKNLRMKYRKKELCPKCEEGGTGKKMGPLMAAGIGGAVGGLMNGKGLDEMEMKRLSGALEHMKKMVESNEMSDEDRLEAYHQAKNMDEMAGDMGMEGGMDAEGMKGMEDKHPLRKLAGEASKALKKACAYKMVDGQTRDEIAGYAKAMEDAMMEKGMHQEPDGDEVVPPEAMPPIDPTKMDEKKKPVQPGDMGQKGLTKQEKELQELLEKMQEQNLLYKQALGIN